MFADSARQRLVASGMDSARVANLPDLQAVFLDAAKELEVIVDDMEKTSLLPYSPTHSLTARIDQKFNAWLEDTEAA